MHTHIHRVQYRIFLHNTLVQISWSSICRFRRAVLRMMCNVVPSYCTKKFSLFLPPISPAFISEILSHNFFVPAVLILITLVIDYNVEEPMAIDYRDYIYVYVRSSIIYGRANGDLYCMISLSLTHTFSLSLSLSLFAIISISLMMLSQFSLSLSPPL